MLRISTLLGKLVLRNIPSRIKNCTTTEDLLKALPEIYDVQVPDAENIIGIFKSSSTPSADVRENIWLRTAGDSTPISFSFFLSNRWIEFPLKNMPIWLTGNYATAKEDLERNGFFLMNGAILGVPNMTDLFQGTDPNWTRYAVSFVGVTA